MAGSERTITEEIRVAGGQLVERVKELLAEGQVRRLRLKGADGEPIVEIPLNVGALAGTAAAVAAPWLVLVATFAGLVGHVTLEVVRVNPDASIVALTAKGGGRSRKAPAGGAKASVKAAKAAKSVKTAKPAKSARTKKPVRRK